MNWTPTMYVIVAVAVIAGILGFWGIITTIAWIAKIIFYIAIAALIASFFI